MEQGELDQVRPAAPLTSLAGNLSTTHSPFAAAIILAQILLLGMGCALVRMVRGPHAQDRMLALDAFCLSAMILLLTIGIRTGSRLYVEAGMTLALPGFAGTFAFAKFLSCGEVIK